MLVDVSARGRILENPKNIYSRAHNYINGWTERGDTRRKIIASRLAYRQLQTRGTRFAVRIVRSLINVYRIIIIIIFFDKSEANGDICAKLRIIIYVHRLCCATHAWNEYLEMRVHIWFLWENLQVATDWKKKWEMSENMNEKNSVPIFANSFLGLNGRFERTTQQGRRVLIYLSYKNLFLHDWGSFFRNPKD